MLYSIPGDASSGVQRKFISSDGSSPADESLKDSIGVYEKGDVRVVALPIPKDLTDNREGQKFYENLQE